MRRKSMRQCPKAKGQAKGNAQSSAAKVENKSPDARKGGKGGGKGKRGKSEPRTVKRKQQCIHFFRGTCQRGDQCRYEHQVDEDGRPVPVGREILQRFDEAVKRYNENRAQAQAKPKAALRGGVTASMIALEPDDIDHGIVLNAAQALTMISIKQWLIQVPTQSSPAPQNARRDCGVPSPKCHSHWSYCSSLWAQRCKEIGCCLAKFSHLSVTGMVDYSWRVDILFRTKARTEEHSL